MFLFYDPTDVAYFHGIMRNKKKIILVPLDSKEKNARKILQHQISQKKKTKESTINFSQPVPSIDSFIKSCKWHKYNRALNTCEICVARSTVLTLYNKISNLCSKIFHFHWLPIFSFTDLASIYSISIMGQGPHFLPKQSTHKTKKRTKRNENCWLYMRCSYLLRWWSGTFISHVKA